MLDQLGFALSYAGPAPIVRSVRSRNFIAVLCLGFALVAKAESARIIKVLPHFLDEKGRSSINPSLFDRDAYQAELRGDPKRRSGLRFNVQWKASGYDVLTLRVEAKGDSPQSRAPKAREVKVAPGSLSRWTPVTFDGADYKALGEVIAWRATLRDGTNVVAEQKSFLW